MKILLIAGHGDGDSGACANGYKEADLTREVVALIHEKLSSYADVDVADTKKNWHKHIIKLKNFFNFKVYDYVLEVHFNKTESGLKTDGKTTGTEIYVTKSESGTTVEEKMLANMKSVGFKDRGVKKVNFDLISYIKKQGVSAALIEMCFLDDLDDMKLYESKKNETINAIVNGIVDEFNLKTKEVTSMAEPITVMKLPTEVYIQEITPSKFKIEIVDKEKKDIPKASYFTGGFWGEEGTANGKRTIPVGNLAIDGKIVAQSKDQGDWINVAKKKLTTIYTKKDGTCGITRTDTLENIPNLNYAISGIPIIVGGYKVDMKKEEGEKKHVITDEGYFGNECYDTWHGFLGIRHNKLVYVAMNCAFEQMCWALVALGIYDAIKLDGGGSFIMKNGTRQKYTTENRRINNIITWM